MSWPVFSADGISGEDEDSWQFNILFPASKGSPLCVFHSTKDAVRPGKVARVTLCKSEEAVCGMPSARKRQSEVRFHLLLLDLLETFGNFS